MNPKIEASPLPKCFVIMPISDQPGYDTGHFKRVYEGLIIPACESAGFEPKRADDVAATNLIILDIIRDIVNCEMAICDLSGRNPNVLFELGIRQAFNKPVTLIKDLKTERIFDIQGLRNIDYNHQLRFDTVASDISSIAMGLTETKNGHGKEVNSLIQLLGMKAASIVEGQELSIETQIILTEIQNIRKGISHLEYALPLTTLPTGETIGFGGNQVYMFEHGEKVGLSEDSQASASDVLFFGGRKYGKILAITKDDVVIERIDKTLERIGKEEIKKRGFSRDKNRYIKNI